MDKIILGLLMMRRLTIYEIRSAIRSNLQDMCSDSMGSIQAAIKKLLDLEMIAFEECVENSVNKKFYRITAKGRSYFLDWLKEPMTTRKSKNMELSKLFFMGLAPKEDRIGLIGEYIEELRGNLNYLRIIEKATGDVEGQMDQYVDGYRESQSHLEPLKNGLEERTEIERVRDIATFSLLTLQYGMSATVFEISWYEELKRKLEAEEI